MAAKAKDAAVCIRSKYPKAIYTHCTYHRLNLSVVKCCNIQGVNNTMATANSIAKRIHQRDKLN